MTFEINGKVFIKDGKPVKLISGACTISAICPTRGEIFSENSELWAVTALRPTVRGICTKNSPVYMILQIILI